MIERFSISNTAAQLSERYKVEPPVAFHPRYNVAPSQLIPVITLNEPRGFSHFYWGQPPGWTKNKSIAEKIINVRSEHFLERTVLKKKIVHQRCMIPSDGFYAWKKFGKKSLIPWRFILKDKSIFSMAGLWEEYEDEEGKTVHTFTLITVPANNYVAQVCERMPVMLTESQESIWLNKNSTEDSLLGLLSSVSSELMEGFSVSTQLNTLSFDRPSLLLPMPPADQFGNLTLFD